MTVRAWFGGAVPPAPELLLQVEAADAHPVCLYAVTDGREAGEWAPVVQALRAKMETVRNDPAALRAYSPERSQCLFLASLFGLARSPQDRARLLRQLGAFAFPASDREAKARTARLLADREGALGQERWTTLARELERLWQPEGLLRSVVHAPADVAAAVVSRLSPTHAAPLVIWGHAFAGVSRALLEPLAQGNTVAYERDAEIHVVTAVRPALEAWDADEHLQGAPEDYSLLEVLVLHEILETILGETTRLEPLASHLVAVTLGRSLRDSMLALAVEAFCLDWLEAIPAASSSQEDGGDVPGAGPDLSDAELAESERQAAARSIDAQRELLEGMFGEGPAALPPVAEPVPRAEPPSRRPAAREPIIRSTVGDRGGDLSGLFGAAEEERPPATPDPGPAAEDPDARRKRSYHFTPLEGEGPRVLVVDDSSMTRHLVCEVARKMGCQTVEATDGVQAVALALYHRPDLIVLDITMPGGNGMAALRQLRGRPECATTPIIMLTVESGRASIQSAIRQGASDYLVKPVNVKELARRMAQRLGEGRAG